MDVATLDQLLGPTGRAALAAARELQPTETKYPACFDRLRKHFSPELARAALDTVMLREKARAKFARADEMVFTREALEMASAEPVARYRAERFAPFGTVADLCCGIGGDAIGLASAGVSVVAVDRDPLRVRMAEANLAAYGLIQNPIEPTSGSLPPWGGGLGWGGGLPGMSQYQLPDDTLTPHPNPPPLGGRGPSPGGRFVCADVLTVDLADCVAAFADPGRRPGGRRTLSPHDSEPPVPDLVARFPRDFPLGVKVAPGFPKDELADFDAGPEFVSLHGELKECVLWFGPFKTGVRATVLPGPHTLTGYPDAAVDLGSVGAFLYDPDPAVTRAGLVGELGRRLSARQIDPRIAFLTSDALTATPFASVYRVEEVLPFHARRVGEWLKAQGVGRVTVVKRGSAVEADELAARWKLRGDGHRAVILTRAVGGPVAIIGERVEA
ncbi:MAG TPA: class I SAM-dependent methyltransferase [Fimbriiglobus sp.]|nr:class I SAM-dependent methyltransferase [Fimbriiglobus sp.]